MNILVLNSGSSSLKTCLYEIGETSPVDPLVPLWEGRVELGDGYALLVTRNCRGAVRKEKIQVSSRQELIRLLLRSAAGLSSDMRDILSAIGQGHTRAKLALDIYVHRIRAAIGGMAAVLGGVDAVVFTAGVGENSGEVRDGACRGLEFAGLRLDEKANAKPCLDQDIARVDSKVRVLVIKAQEEWAIARECSRMTQSRRPSAVAGS